MRLEDQLPRELADVETRLRLVTPRPSGIDCDQLMYRAGFAAGRARTAKQLWSRPLVVAAAAALIAAGLTQFAHQRRLAPADGQLSGSTAQSDVRTSIDPHPVTNSKDEPISRPGLRPPAFRFDAAHAPLLAARERALQFQFDEPLPQSRADADNSIRPAASIQQLRDEVLPRTRQAAASHGVFSFSWPWLNHWTLEVEDDHENPSTL